MQRRVTARAIIVDESGKLFCVRLTNYKDSHSRPHENRCVPGGGVDIGEPIIPALEREIVEELGVQPTIGELLYIQQFTTGEKEQFELFFHVLNFKDFLHIDLAKTSHGVKEIAELGFVDNTSINLLPKFLKDQDLSQIKVTGNSVKIFNNIS